MSIFESKVELDKPVAEVFAFLSDFNNHKQLMPDTITNWSSTTDEARFSVQNMAKLSLKISNRIENETIIIIPDDKVPFNVEMRWVLADLGNNTTEVIFTVMAELNMMMKMMAGGPLQSLVNYQTEALKKVL
ncbi:MAG: SRPBCC family protein [Sphingobacteriaceae bacterium]|nr:SRPBCC family protein [Sphingobacteriaceae bacterium]